ncbi:hypothetical protein [Amycolatopsis sp. NPDC059021]|uniref:hypothetical protein n=1 Tax=Amycolatopsis sp. NPDC059021 TaxID=3346704 RepID=UPI00366C84BE
MSLKSFAVLAVVVAALLSGLAVYIAVVKRPHASSAGGQPAPATFTLRGSVTINNNLAGSIGYDGTSCRGGGGFSDLTPGTAVVVANGTGQILATGSLGTTLTAVTTMSAPLAGLPAAPFVTGCVLSFAVRDVPDGLPSYVLTISHRGSRVIPASEAHDGVRLVIG